MRVLHNRRPIDHAWRTSLADMSMNEAYNIIDASDLPDGSRNEEAQRFTRSQRSAWDAIADHWNMFQHPEANGRVEDGNDMFNECLLPVVDELVSWRPGETVLDLGAGSGIICRRFAKQGAQVVGLDFSEAMLDVGRELSRQQKLDHLVEFGTVDLTDVRSMKTFMEKRKRRMRADGKDEVEARFDIITISTTVKSLSSLEALAEMLPRMLKPNGRIVIVDLHPAFSKPAGHRGMEIFEDPKTGRQQLSTYIKVPKYLNIPPTMSEAVRGQPEPLMVFHRPLWALMEPFFRCGLVLDGLREPAFEGERIPSQAQSYHNFQQTPMLLAYRLRHCAPRT
ncbi:Ubiquinone biosynthesis O-methyltransferase [Pseudocercospora fuligena]|uniref:Ubiquinone biosynthesis O-methyltransferase n=1 Tax=Pseudocercospora fuligena TaxID=685502 RepID=A0A8H6VKS3_9PEZI|nr:Ubiquinone biosynthesis O-methyltransferase [Pseudocercospora fuligena]